MSQSMKSCGHNRAHPKREIRGLGLVPDRTKGCETTLFAFYHCAGGCLLADREASPKGVGLQSIADGMIGGSR